MKTSHSQYESIIDTVLAVHQGPRWDWFMKKMEVNEKPSGTVLLRIQYVSNFSYPNIGKFWSTNIAKCRGLVPVITRLWEKGESITLARMDHNSYTIWDWFCAPLQPLHSSPGSLLGEVMETLCRAGTFGECGAAANGEGRQEEGVFCVSAYGEPLILQPTWYVVGRSTSIPW